MILNGLYDKTEPIVWGNKSKLIMKPFPKTIKKNKKIETDKKVKIRSDNIDNVTIIFASKKV